MSRLVGEQGMTFGQELVLVVIVLLIVAAVASYYYPAAFTDLWTGLQHGLTGLGR